MNKRRYYLLCAISELLYCYVLTLIYRRSNSLISCYKQQPSNDLHLVLSSVVRCLCNRFYVAIGVNENCLETETNLCSVLNVCPGFELNILS